MIVWTFDVSATGSANLLFTLMLLQKVSFLVAWICERFAIAVRAKELDLTGRLSVLNIGT